MPRYISLGRVPRKRHTQFRKPDGGLYSEEVFGSRGFSGIASILYHIHPPTRIVESCSLTSLVTTADSEAPLRHRHFRTRAIEPNGDPITGRKPLLRNDDVSLSICRPSEPMNYLYKSADGDDLIYIQSGAGTLHTMFGPLAYGRGDYLVIPRGTVYRLDPDGADTRMLVIESRSAIETPRRYRNEYGQLLEHAPYCERDIRVPTELETIEEHGSYEVRIKARGRLSACVYGEHPFDLVGWDGFLYPWALNIGDFEPITGSLHQPPTTHQTFEANNFVVCSFVPRMLDYHPDAVPVPYNHSNLDSDEVLFYCNDQFGSRRGIEEGSVTLHPSGIPHGPQPGAVEASLGRTRTEELAVMVDTFRPLTVTAEAATLEDTDYLSSWLAEPNRGS